jgi:hypothetical protein
MENFMIYHQSRYLEMSSSYSLLFISNIARRIMSHFYAIIHRIFIKKCLKLLSKLNSRREKVSFVTTGHTSEKGENWINNGKIN